MEITVQKLTEKEIEDRGIKSWSIWEKEVSRFDWYYGDKEECLLLEGRVEFGEGDFVTFPKGLKCVWDIKEDVKHPAIGSFVPTMPISLMILALVYIQVGPNLFGQDLAYKAACTLFWIGTVGIYLFSWIIIPLLFQNEKVSYDHGTFGWYIPPVCKSPSYTSSWIRSSPHHP